MFKRSLTAVAVLGVMAGVASAGSVQLYGKLDTGLAWTRTKLQDQAATTSFGMGSGLLNASRLGVKGTEDLGNGMTVGFKLESKLSSTTGAAGTDGSFFNREASLSVGGAFGKVIVGYFGTLRSSAGPVGIGNLDPLGAGDYIGGWGNLLDAQPSRLTNNVAYASPEFGGAKVYAQYAMGSGKVQNKKDSVNRYLGLGATFDQGPLHLTAVVDSYLQPKTDTSKNEYALTLGGSYDFGSVKPVLQLAFFKNGNALEGYKLNGALASGMAVQAGAEIPAGPGSVIGTLGYGHASAKAAGAKTNKYNTWNLGLAYAYPMSKRTTLYAGAGYLRTQDKNLSKTTKLTNSFYQAAVGLVHAF